jgi:hypothetical protein
LKKSQVFIYENIQFHIPDFLNKSRILSFSTAIAIRGGVMKNIDKETNRQERQGRKDKKEKREI